MTLKSDLFRIFWFEGIYGGFFEKGLNFNSNPINKCLICSYIELI